MRSPAVMQHTLNSPATIRGVGLFTGAPVTATLRPGEAGTGIIFRRLDLPGQPTVAASINYVASKPRRTVLQNGKGSVEMVEHCLSALSGMGVDNAVVDLDGPELPAGDGSAAAFVDAIRAAGVVPQDKRREPLVITEPITLRDGEAALMVMPAESDESEFVYVLDYGPGSPIERQVHAFKMSPAAYAEEIAPARTFSTAADAQRARDAGLFKHVSPRDMLVIDENGPVDNAYRFEHEPVRHKLLDLLGDLALIGRPIKGRIIAVRSGHALNHKMARELLARAGAGTDTGQRPMPPDTGQRPTAPKSAAMDIREVLDLLPHRFPMVMIDRVLELEEGKRAVGIKNVTINEPFFQGHYPASPIMPGVLIVEAMCQLAGVMLHGTLEHKGKIAVLLSLDGIKLRKAVTPGDQLRIETEVLRATARFGEAKARAWVGGDLAAEVEVIKFLMLSPDSPKE